MNKITAGREILEHFHPSCYFNPNIRANISTEVDIKIRAEGFDLLDRQILFVTNPLLDDSGKLIRIAPGSFEVIKEGIVDNRR